MFVIYSLINLFLKTVFTCEDIAIRYHIFYDYYGVLDNNDLDIWHDMSFSGGHMNMPSVKTIHTECFKGFGNVIALEGPHPDVTALSEDVVSVQVCSLSQNKVCEKLIGIDMRKCHGDLLYRFPSLNFFKDLDETDQVICLERYFRDTCHDTKTVYTVSNANGNFIHFQDEDLQLGWFDAFVNEKQFVLPSIEELRGIFTSCLIHGRGYALLDPVPKMEENVPKRLRLCYIWNDNYDTDCYRSYEDVYAYENYIHARICDGKLQFNLGIIKQRNWSELICLVHQSTVKPEIGHDIRFLEMNGNRIVSYSPFLQYRCVFPMTSGVRYKTNWFINGSLHANLGPSENPDELIFRAANLSFQDHTYEVQCGAIPEFGNDANELLSFVFTAGWMIFDNSLTLSKSGHVLAYIKQTIPLGCYYNGVEEPDCEEEIVFVNDAKSNDICTGSIRVQNDNISSESSLKVQSLKKGDQWKGSITYRARLTTVDSNYDDAIAFYLQVHVTNGSNQKVYPGHSHFRHRTVKVIRISLKLKGYTGKDWQMYSNYLDSYIPAIFIFAIFSFQNLGGIQIRITDDFRHWNKRCYSHVDPHMKTVDGLHYEAQKEGDYILYRNRKYQTEVQQSARYCDPRSQGDGPVCACGIAVAEGADTFIFNRCNRIIKFDLQCEDGGLIDIVEMSPHRYLVITPIGTVIDVVLHDWSKTMNIDIYMSAKDFGNVDGLCGTFDGNRSNDLLHRDKNTISYDENQSYRFADSWRIPDEENLFINDKRLLKSWNSKQNGKVDPPCGRPNSLTKRKCKINRRKRRATKVILQEKHQMISHKPVSLRKRSAESFTEEEAFVMCNNSIYATPAVIDFPEYLAEEDPDVVVEQCVYDLIIGGDAAWVEAHVNNLNNVVDTVLSLNPIFVANNTDKVNTFRSKICLNNCSGNGECLVTGVCECHGTFRGADCTDDIRIPPVVYSIEGDGICEVTVEDDCTCFEIRSENIFDGFMCNIIEYKMYLNGTKVKLQQSTHAGYYEDIFTGECCAPGDRKRRSPEANEDEPFIISYELYVSNDGATYGDINSLFVFDASCLQQIANEDTVTIEVKNGYCFIERSCVAAHEFLSTEDCLLCDPAANRYNWTKGTCEDGDTHNAIELIIGLGIVCPLVVIASFVLSYICCCKKSRSSRRIHDSNTCLQTKVTSIRLPESGNTSFMFYKHNL